MALHSSHTVRYMILKSNVQFYVIHCLQIPISIVLQRLRMEACHVPHRLLAWPPWIYFPCVKMLGLRMRKRQTTPPIQDNPSQHKNNSPATVTKLLSLHFPTEFRAWWETRSFSIMVCFLSASTDVDLVSHGSFIMRSLPIAAFMNSHWALTSCRDTYAH